MNAIDDVKKMKHFCYISFTFPRQILYRNCYFISTSYSRKAEEKSFIFFVDLFFALHIEIHIKFPNVLTTYRAEISKALELGKVFQKSRVVTSCKTE